jgi:hypothetical protein
MKEALSILAGFIGGGIVALIAHYFAVRREDQNRKHAAERDRKARKLAFLSFLRGWRIDVVRKMLHKTAETFTEQVRLFEEAAEYVTDDYGPQFEERVKRVSSMKNGYVEQPHGHQELIEAMDKVRDWVRAN